MIDVNLERLRAHQKNIDRYRRLLGTHLSDLERSYIERRLSEEQASIKGLLRETVPDRLSALLPRVEGCVTPFDMATMLHPADAFAHPMDIVDDCDLTSYEKRAILSSWASDACAVPEPSRRTTAVRFDDILDALQLLESEPEFAVDDGEGSDRHHGRNGPNTLSIDL
jgi:hypothetical protein